MNDVQALIERLRKADSVWRLADAAELKLVAAAALAKLVRERDALKREVEEMRRLAVLRHQPIAVEPCAAHGEIHCDCDK